MKKLFTLVAALLFAATVWAQSSSPKMSYQAVVRNAANELVVNRTDLTVEVSIKQADTVAFKETHANVKTNQNGLLSLLIGDGTVTEGSLNDVDWTKAEFVTKINLGGESVTATAPATAVPYALYAESVNPNSEIINNIQGDINNIQGDINNIQGDINNIKENYLTKAGLCDSIKSCQTIKDMDNSISENKAAIEAIDGRIRTDSLEIVELYASTMESVLGKIKTDSSALAGQIATNANQIATNTGNISTNTSEIASIKENYLTIDGLCDSIKSCDAIKDLNDTLDFYYTKEDIKDTLNAYYDTTKINDTLKSYLTISGLCDSIKSCDAIKDLTDTLDFYYTKKEIKDTLNAYYDTTKINDTLKSYLTIDGLCDSIKSCDAIKDLTDTLKYYYTKTDADKKFLTISGLCDSIKSCDAIKDLTDTLDFYYTKKEIKDTLNAYYDTTSIKNLLNNYTIKTCEDVAACVNTALSDASSTTNNLVDSIVDEHIKLADSLATKTYVDNALSSYVTTESLNTTLGDYYTKSETYSQSEVDTKFDTLANYALISQEKALTFNPLTSADSAKLLTDTTLTIPTGSVLDTCHLVKLYINGVYVGDNADGVLVVTDKKKVRYDYTKNGGYKLAVGDRIKILYWVKKN